MPMTTKVKVNGSWVEPSNIWVKHNGIWRDSQKVFVKNAGTWQQVFPAYVPGSIQWTTASTHNFTVPTGVYSLSYVVIGGGAGGGGGSEKDPHCTGGGGGGAGAIKTGTLSVTPGQVLTCVIGAGGTGWGGMNQSGGSTPGDSTINGTLVIAENGGKPRIYDGETWWRPYFGFSGTGSINGTSGTILANTASDPANGGAGGYVPGYSTGGIGGTGSGAAGIGPGAGGGGGATTGNDGGNYPGGDGNDGMIRLVW